MKLDCTEALGDLCRSYDYQLALSVFIRAQVRMVRIRALLC